MEIDIVINSNLKNESNDEFESGERASTVTSGKYVPS